MNQLLWYYAELGIVQIVSNSISDIELQMQTLEILLSYACNLEGLQYKLNDLSREKRMRSRF